MKKLESTLINMVGVLVCVALIMGGILAYVNHITEGPISEQAQKALSDGTNSLPLDQLEALLATIRKIHEIDR